MNRQVNEACIALQTALHDRPMYQTEHPDPAGVLLQLQQVLEADLSFYSSLFTSSGATSAAAKIRNVFVEYMLEHENEFAIQDHNRYLFGLMFASGGVISMYQDWFGGKLPITLDQLTAQAIDVTRSIAAISSR